jgi:predicted DNA-binding protein
MSLTKHITLRIPQELIDRIGKLTEEDGRSISAYLRQAVVERVRKDEYELKQYENNPKH